MKQAQVDVAIIGAGEMSRLPRPARRAEDALRPYLPYLGLAGIVFARFHLDTHPDCRLVILEKDGCIGGVWSAGMQCPHKRRARGPADLSDMNGIW